MKQSRTISGVVEAAPLPPPSGTIPAFPASTTHPDWNTWLKYAKLTASGTNQFNYDIHHVAEAWAIDGRRDNALRDWCVKEWRRLMAVAFTQWNAGQPVAYFTRDAGLYGGDVMLQLVLPLNWMADQLTTDEIALASKIFDQVIFNIWNPTQASWNGVAAPWSPYSINDPLDNYFYRAHLKATLLWAIHSQSPSWLQKIASLLPVIRTAYAKLIGGGSFEGTGYGKSAHELFRDVWLMKSALGIDLTADCRVAETIAYFVNATTPDYKSVAGIGDLPPSLDDAARSIVIWGCILVPQSPQAELGRYWVAKAAKPARAENCWLTAYDTPGTQTPLAANASYFASGVGHCFARDTAANALLCVRAGELIESHAHRDQGGVQLYLNGWRLADANRFGKSGILQSVAYHNCVTFRDANGKVIEAQFADPTPPKMSVADDGDTCTITANLKPAYDNAPNILTYSRSIVWTRSQRSMVVRDDFATANGVTGAQRWTVADAPAIQADGSYICGPLTVRGTGTAQAPVNWKVSEPASFAVDCWRLEFSGAMSYAMEARY